MLKNQQLFWDTCFSWIFISNVFYLFLFVWDLRVTKASYIDFDKCHAGQFIHFLIVSLSVLHRLSCNDFYAQNSTFSWQWFMPARNKDISATMASFNARQWCSRKINLTCTIFSCAYKSTVYHWHNHLRSLRKGTNEEVQKKTGTFEISFFYDWK